MKHPHLIPRKSGKKTYFHFRGRVPLDLIPRLIVWLWRISGGYSRRWWGVIHCEWQQRKKLCTIGFIVPRDSVVRKCEEVPENLSPRIYFKPKNKSIEVAEYLYSLSFLIFLYTYLLFSLQYIHLNQYTLPTKMLTKC